MLLAYKWWSGDLKFSTYHWYYSASTDVNISSHRTSINRILYWNRFQNRLSTRLSDLDLRVILRVSRAPALTCTLLHSAHNNYGQITDVFAITVTSPPPPAHHNNPFPLRAAHHQSKYQRLHFTCLLLCFEK